MGLPQECVMKLPVLLVALAGSAASAQTRVLFLDRTAGAQAVWVLDDLNANGTMEEPAELAAYFNNTTGISPPMATPGSIAVYPGDGMVAVGDSSVRGIYILLDSNRNNTAMNVGESL